jgi:hypothetical protein
MPIGTAPKAYLTTYKLLFVCNETHGGLFNLCGTQGAAPEGNDALALTAKSTIWRRAGSHTTHSEHGPMRRQYFPHRGRGKFDRLATGS